MADGVRAVSALMTPSQPLQGVPAAVMSPSPPSKRGGALKIMSETAPPQPQKRPPAPTRMGKQTEKTRTRQVAANEGFAGLSALKEQLEKQRPRTSRPSLNDLGSELFKQQNQAQLRRRQEVAKSPTSGKTEVPRGGTSPGKESSSDGSREGGTTLIRVTNLAKQVTEEEYKLLMQSIPGVTGWTYLSDRGGQCLGYGFCEVHAGSDIEGIIQYLSEKVLHGKKMKASLSVRSENEYKQSLQRQTRPAAISDGARKETRRGVSSASILRERVTKGNSSLQKQGELRSLWKAQPSSREAGATETKYVEFSSQNGNTGEKLISRETKIELEPKKFTPSTVEREAGESVSSRSLAPSPGTDDESGTRLTGQSVLAALQRAAALRDSRPKPRKRKGGKHSSDSDNDDDSKQGPLPPLVFKPEWASKIEELEHDLKQLRMLS